MNDWKELKIDDLSDCPDILTGNYEFMFSTDGGKWVEIEKDETVIGYLDSAIADVIAILYRKRQPKAPSHEELCTSSLWWLCDDGQWNKIVAIKPFDDVKGFGYRLQGQFHPAEWFAGRKSAEVPPE